MGEGSPIPYCRLRIADDADQELPPEHAGHVLISGENVTRGYFEDAVANAAAFTQDGWLRTGDLGVIHDGQLYISGRAKEIIFVNGQNYYPHDLEMVAQRLKGIELGKLVAVGVHTSGTQTEQLVMFLLHRGSMQEFLPLATQVARTYVNEQTGAGSCRSGAGEAHSTKTTSGKIQRHLLEEKFPSTASSIQSVRSSRRSTSRCRAWPRNGVAHAARGSSEVDLRQGPIEGKRVRPARQSVSKSVLVH